MKKYDWEQLSQWDERNLIPGLCKRYETIETYLSGKNICTYILVKKTDKGNNVTHSEPVKEIELTPEMLEIAGNI